MRTLDFNPPINPGAGTPDARRRYLYEQGPRFAATFEQCVATCPDKSAAVLDVGRSKLSSLLLGYYDQVTTLGLDLDITQNYAHAAGWEPPEGKDYGGHIVLDLNAIPTDRRSRIEQRFDLIVFAEVIEHLYIAPEMALAQLHKLLKSDGVILCTTPNAVSLPKRLKLLFGYNPFERLRADLTNPGHIREYTRAELAELGHRAGLAVVMHRYLNYRAVSSSGGLRFMARFGSRTLSLTCPCFRDFQMIVFRPR
jgi:SAM-dependent methyltransferase